MRARLVRRWRCVPAGQQLAGANVPRGTRENREGVAASATANSKERLRLSWTPDNTTAVHGTAGLGPETSGEGDSDLVNVTRRDLRPTPVGLQARETVPTLVLRLPSTAVNNLAGSKAARDVRTCWFHLPGLCSSGRRAPAAESARDGHGGRRRGGASAASP